MKTIIAVMLLVAASPAWAQTSTYTSNGKVTDSAVRSPDGSARYERTIIDPKTGNVTLQSTYVPAPKPLEGYSPMGASGYHPMGR
jgi:hypothetical protein